MRIRYLAVGLLATLAVTACGRGDGPTDDDVMNAIVAYYGSLSISSGGTEAEALAKIKKATTIKGCKADEAHSTSTARAYECKVWHKGMPKDAVAHLLLESGQWRMTSMDG